MRTREGLVEAMVNAVRIACGALAITASVACGPHPVMEGEDSEQTAPLAGPLPAPPAAKSLPPGGTWTAPPPGSTPTNVSPAPDAGVNPGYITPPPPPSATPGSTPTYAPPPSNDPYALARDFCVQRTNQYRASIGRAPLQRVQAAESCLDRQAVNDAQMQTAHGAFSYCNELAQNECPGWPGPLSNVLPSCLDSMWAEGPGGGHYENMASTKYQYAACGFYQAADGAWWIVQDFR